MKNLHGKAGAPGGLAQGPLRPIQGPGRLQETTFLVAVGVADHDLLQVAPKQQVTPVDGQIDQALYDGRRVAQRLHHFKEGHEMKQADALLRPKQPRLPSQQQYLQQVRRLGRPADDVGVDGLGTLLLKHRRDGAERLHHLPRVRRKGQVGGY